MRIDISSYGRQLEKLIGDRMLPYEKGLYVPTNSSPVIRSNVTYCIAENTGVKVYNGAELLDNRKLITGDVLSEQGELVLPVRAVRLLSTTPYLPYRSFLLISTIIERRLHNHFIYTKVKKEGLLDIIESYITKVPGVKAEDDDLDYIYDEVVRILQPLENMVLEFMAEDHFHVHFQYLHGTDLIIEKSVDYRIHVFNEKVASGEWDV